MVSPTVMTLALLIPRRIPQPVQVSVVVLSLIRTLTLTVPPTVRMVVPATLSRRILVPVIVVTQTRIKIPMGSSTVWILVPLPRRNPLETVVVMTLLVRLTLTVTVSKTARTNAPMILPRL